MKNEKEKAMIRDFGPKKVCLSKRNAIKGEFKLPNNKVIVIKRGKEYITADQTELDFFSKQKAVIIMDLNDQEFLSYAAKNPLDLPTVQNRSLTIEDVIDKKLSTDEEEAVVNKLKDMGYTIYKRKDR